MRSRAENKVRLRIFFTLPPSATTALPPLIVKNNCDGIMSPARRTRNPLTCHCEEHSDVATAARTLAEQKPPLLGKVTAKQSAGLKITGGHSPPLNFHHSLTTTRFPLSAFFFDTFWKPLSAHLIFTNGV